MESFRKTAKPTIDKIHRDYLDAAKAEIIDILGDGWRYDGVDGDAWDADEEEMLHLSFTTANEDIELNITIYGKGKVRLWAVVYNLELEDSTEKEKTTTLKKLAETLPIFVKK